MKAQLTREPFSSSPRTDGPDSILVGEAHRPRLQGSKGSGIVDLETNNPTLIFCLERWAPRWTAAIQRRSLSSFYIRKDGVHLLVVSLNVSAQFIAARCAIARHSCPHSLELFQFAQISLDHHMLKVSMSLTCCLSHLL